MVVINRGYVMKILKMKNLFLFSLSVSLLFACGAGGFYLWEHKKAKEKVFWDEYYCEELKQVLISNVLRLDRAKEFPQDLGATRTEIEEIEKDMNQRGYSEEEISVIHSRSADRWRIQMPIQMSMNEKRKQQEKLLKQEERARLDEFYISEIVSSYFRLWVNRSSLDNKIRSECENVYGKRFQELKVDMYQNGYGEKEISVIANKAHLAALAEWRKHLN